MLQHSGKMIALLVYQRALSWEILRQIAAHRCVHYTSRTSSRYAHVSITGHRCTRSPQFSASHGNFYSRALCREYRVDTDQYQLVEHFTTFNCTYHRGLRSKNRDLSLTRSREARMSGYSPRSVIHHTNIFTEFCTGSKTRKMLSSTPMYYVVR